MTVLVTGASGFIGQGLTRRLLERGTAVRVLVRDSGRLAGLGLDGVEVVEGDITDPAAVDRAVAGTEVVFAIAGTFREPNLSNARYREVNVAGVRHTLEAANRHGVRRVVHCSTVGIHGKVEGPPATEAAPIAPDGIYEETKAEGDQLALRFGRENGLEVVVIRPASVYGPGDTRLLKLFKLARKKHVLLLGPGTCGYHLVYIDDLVGAFLLAADAPGVAGEAFLVAGPEQSSLNQLVTTLARVLDNPQPKIIRLPAQPVRLLGHLCEVVCRPLGIAPPLYRRRVDFFINNRAYDIGKAKRCLGYAPAVGLVEGLERTAAWYRGDGLL
jgi:dihydroflavonol-4-reductase